MTPAKTAGTKLIDLGRQDREPWTCATGCSDSMRATLGFNCGGLWVDAGAALRSPAVLDWRPPGCPHAHGRTTGIWLLRKIGECDRIGAHDPQTGYH